MTSKSWKMGGGTAVFFVIAYPMWRDFREPEQTGWNVLLALILVGILVAAFLLQRYFKQHIGEIGEARFDTSNERDRKKR